MKYLLEQEIKPSLPLAPISDLTSGVQRVSLFLFFLRISHLRDGLAGFMQQTGAPGNLGDRHHKIFLGLQADSCVTVCMMSLFKS